MPNWLEKTRDSFEVFREWTRVFACAACFLAACALLSKDARGQMPRAPVPSDASGQIPGAPESEAQRQMEKKQEQRQNEDRQKELVRDTDKLLALATDLKADVEKTNKDVLSVEVVKKAEEIEKLARSVKERMRSR